MSDVLADPTENYELFLHQITGDFRLFLIAHWHFIGLPFPSAAQLDIAHFLQHGPKHRVIKAARGFGKTWITLSYACWLLLRNPDERIIIISESLGFARTGVRLVRMWIDNVPWLKHLAPRKGTKQRDNTDEFDAGPSMWNNQPSLKALGITGQLTGNRATHILPDDPETPETSLTVNSRKLLRDRVKEFEYIGVPGYSVSFLGTPHCEESLYVDLAKSGYTCRAWPAEYPRADEPVPDLAPLLARQLTSGEAKPGDPTWPERFGIEHLAGVKVRNGASSYAMQYQLRTSLTDLEARPLRLSDLIVYPVHRDVAPLTIAWGTKGPNGSTAVNDMPSVGLGDDQYFSPIFIDERRSPYHATKMFVDPSGGTGNDETAWAIGGELNGYIHIKAAGGYRGPHNAANLLQIVLAARRHGVNEIYVENNFGGDMLVLLLKPILQRHFVPEKSRQFPQGWACSVEGVRSSGQKELRIIDALEPVMAQHRLVIDPAAATLESGLDYAYQLPWQLTRITRQRDCLPHDDRVEAVSGVVRQFASVLDQDASVQAERYEEEERDRDLRVYSERCDDQFGDNTPPTWVRI